MPEQLSGNHRTLLHFLNDTKLYHNNHENKVGHHGSSSSTTDAFLDKISPEYAVISVGGDNQYGHPTQETLERLQKKNVELYRTDMQGMITCVSDGERVFFQTERNGSVDTYTDAGGYKNAAIESNKAVEEEAAAAAAQQSSGNNPSADDQDGAADGKEDAEPIVSPVVMEYILNTNTKKFHYPSCNSVKQMKDKNKQSSFHNDKRESIYNHYMTGKA